MDIEKILLRTVHHSIIYFCCLQTSNRNDEVCDDEKSKDERQNIFDIYLRRFTDFKPFALIAFMETVFRPPTQFCIAENDDKEGGDGKDECGYDKVFKV